MNPEIRTLNSRKLIGKKLEMSYINNRTAELWRSFMPRRKEIKNKVGAELYSMQIYNGIFDFQTFNPNHTFIKWAAIEVSTFEEVPEEMESYTLIGGLYAVFLHKGSSSEFQQTFQYIFGEWLPNSEYSIDDREHFELLGEKYRNESPDSEEEIWIPIKPRI
ncbi:transcription activator effector binding protein [Emticicia oligotrophica DSM 17448]|uniref:Transcription activator effector binding protein n=1 Tax=Emticicia oligotrophica (strain DSM 17448 / CIP 109782 / MTCC 6937 / GPTSA100-15) TaxID=929562 RepID=A0ABN4AJ68_EMTOG|nr:GyrI-like domain-containing protein [Emticicia oligotrophica]AFK02070.1 transcription activator effector binding protein [Emticicia oligotrophica DSM 17448]